MNGLWEYLKQDGDQWLAPVILLAVTLSAAWLVRWLLGNSRARWNAQSPTCAGDLFLRPLEKTVFLWALLVAAHLGAHASPLSKSAIDQTHQVLLIGLVLSLTWTGSILAGNLVGHLGGKLPTSWPITSLTQNLARWLVLSLGLLILLSLLGISIMPLLTALGIGGLAVALALKDTLSNLFAGFYVSLAGLVRRGDYIKLDSGQEGFVADIGWRCTTLTSSNNLVIIPNEKLAQVIVTNYYLPEKRLPLSLPVNVPYQCDPEKVERILLEVARQGIGEIPGLLADPEPNVRLHPGFGESCLQFTLSCQVARFDDLVLAQHELRKRIIQRFRKEGIEFAVPTRTVHLHEEIDGEHRGASPT